MSLKNTVTPSLSPTNDPWLLTPGPLTTSPTVKQAMLHDYGSRDHGFIGVNKRMRERLLEITRRMFDIEQQALDLLSETRTLRAGTLRIVADAAPQEPGTVPQRDVPLSYDPRHRQYGYRSAREISLRQPAGTPEPTAHDPFCEL